jgi:bifunctional UDP-N-acetylglucosamine pyrophosphorylase/glucosamine-1-phosphate N-acetyltransferase
MIDSVIILAAGAGTKLWPYGETRAKAALPVGNVPIIAHQLRCLVELGITKFTVVTGYLDQQVKGAVLREGIQANFVEQRELNGPVGGLIPALEGQEGDGVLVLYGDVVATVESYGALLESWNGDVDAATMVHKMEGDDPGNWFGASIGGGMLNAIHAHARGGHSHRLCGITILSEKGINYVNAHPGMHTRLDVGAMPSLELDLSQSLQDMVDAGESVAAVETKDHFVDVDKPWHLLEANGRMAEYRNRKLDKNEIAEGAEISEKADLGGFVRLGKNSRIGKRASIQGNVTIGDNTSITNGAMLGGSIIIGDNCRIRDYCQLGTHSVVGNNCVIGHCAEFGGLLMNKVYLYHYCELSGIIGTATDIGAATVCGTLRFDDGRTPHVIKGRREYPKLGSNETYIGEYCRTGVNAIIMPGVKVGAYSILGPGTIIYEDVPSRKLVLAKQEQVTKDWGPEKYGW